MIFHIPWKLKNLGSASQIRPRRMLEAFKQAGYEVREISGLPEEKKNSLKILANEAKESSEFDFAYMEIPTLPVLLGNGYRYFFSELMVEYRFFRFIHKNSIPLGIFYRDAYWRFPQFKKGSKYRQCVLWILYFLEFKFLTKIANVLFVPHIKMMAHLPMTKATVRSLPPGCIPREPHSQRAPKNSGKKTLIYAGGITHHYVMIELFKAFQTVAGWELLIICRKQELEQLSKDILDLLANTNIQIVHAQELEIEGLILNADLCSLLVEPTEYWEFAIPFKFYDYFSYGKSVVVSQNLAIEGIILQEGIGYAIQYECMAIKNFLEKFNYDSSMNKNIENFSLKNTWTERAKQVAYDLSN